MGVSFIERLNLYTGFLDQKGRDELVNAVRQWRDQHGEKWLDEFKDAAPHLADLIDLCANYEFEAAFTVIGKRAEEWIEDEPSTVLRIVYRSMKNGTLDGAKPELAKLHAAVRAEIDRPRI